MCYTMDHHAKLYAHRTRHPGEARPNSLQIMLLHTSVQKAKLLIDNCKVVEYTESCVRAASIMDALQCTSQVNLA